MASLETINLHLIGKQGTGKSMTGNSILGREAFSPSSRKAGNSPIEAIYDKKHDRMANTTLHVWDWPGMDGTQEKKKAISKSFKKLKAEFSEEPMPNQLLLWVMRYGERCDDEDEEFLKILTTELGKSMITEQTIIILTHKDNFVRDNEETQSTFDEWLKQQTGFFKRLHKMCKCRILFFDNRERGPAQVNDLINMIFDMLLGAPKKIPLHPAQPSDPAALKNLPMTSKEKEDCFESLSSSIDEFQKMISGSTQRKTVESLLVLLGKVQSTKGRGGEDVKEALEREIGRKIEEIKAFCNMGEDTFRYLGKLKQKLQLKSADDVEFLDLAEEVGLTK
ncbi:hypothetical protein RRG08_052721 [Elysia crispata]|uniref:AIG1-type G domain-containing protein n=1 Tax=Elysia crispata TaxID=231223 RepID=A0AAE1B4Q5_9GAST|nr:hypothetical protein RRG08_052721 [Elysia crispata]